MSLGNNPKITARPASRESALLTAWWVYLVLMILPFMVLAAVIISSSYTGAPSRAPHNVRLWLLLTLAYFAMALPAGLFYRRHVCGAYFRGELVAPRQYLIGMVAVWVSLELGIVLAIVSCYVTASFPPGLMLALAAFIVFLYLFPTGKMMVSGVGDSEDPEIYQEPR